MVSYSCVAFSGSPILESNNVRRIIYRVTIHCNNFVVVVVVVIQEKNTLSLSLTLVLHIGELTV